VIDSDLKSYRFGPRGNAALEKLFDKAVELLNKGLTGTLTFRIDLKEGGIRNAEQEWRTKVDLT
jgi:hypothetical protein